MTRHLWITAPSADTDRPLLARVDAHRRLRGPYTAAGSLVRALDASPELLARHDIEVLAVAPELDVASTRETLTSLAPPEERTRFYPPARTQRIAHGLTELIRASVAAGQALIIERAHEADPTDVEFIATILRRIDPSHLQILVCAPSPDLALEDALRRRADRRPGSTPPAADYVASDGTDERLRAAYDALDPAERERLHDARADALEQRNELSLTLGAIPYHRERGSDPRGNGAEAVLAALQHCMLYGFYDAVFDLAHRAYALLDWETQPEECWRVTSKLTMALAATGRADDAAALYDHACVQTTLPKIHLHASYGRAMLYTRFFPAERRDRVKAKAYINTAIALSSQLPDRQRRAFDLSFNENGLALIETYLGDPEKALQLVDQGIARVEAELADETLLLHRSVLRYNRAQLLSRMGRPEDALNAYGEAIDADPNQSEYHFERGNLLRRLGRAHEALANYHEAIRTSAPYPQPHIARADVLLELGEEAAALADYSYALELDPTLTDARIGRASLLLDDLEAARADVIAGLAHDPDSAELHALNASIAQQEQRFDEAHDAYAQALRLDPSLAAAWSNRATLWYEQGEVERSIEDLTKALELDDDPDIRANLELALSARE